MGFYRKRVVATLAVLCLTIVAYAVVASKHEHHVCDDACQRTRDKAIELRRDAINLESDVSLLQKSLEHHGSPTQVDQIRYRVHADWGKVVLARGDSRALRQSQSAEFAKRFKQNSQIPPRS